MEKRILMLFSIGPVQDFIAQARKTRDLWFGSYVLSELSKEAARCLSEEFKGQLIFPSFNQQGAGADLRNLRVANKILSIVEMNDDPGEDSNKDPKKDPKSVALRVRSAVARKWLDYAHKAKEKLEGSIIEPMWERQVKDFIEFYSVWTELPSEEEYPEALARLERLMTARKTLRDFRPNEPANLFGDVKSSLNPGRESVLKSGNYEVYAGYGIKETETLDAITLVKRLSRFIGEKREFLSVCDIAFHQFRNQLENPEFSADKEKANRYYRSIRESLKSHGIHLPGDTPQTYDSRMFYANRIEEGIFELAKEQGKSTQISRVIHQQLTQDFTEKLGRLYRDISIKPTPYYAFVVGDGDRMGSCLRNIQTPEEHQRFSQNLSDFAAGVESTIAANSGQLIYSGGDDLMALLPLDCCLAAIREIRQGFSEAMKRALPDANEWPTLSVGVAIVHMIEPMEESLRAAKAAEKEAKKRRDELAIHFQKRSGSGEMKISIPFADAPVEKLLRFEQLYKEGIISTSFAYGLRELYQTYDQIQSKEFLKPGDLGEILFLEIQRMMRKKKPDFLNIQTMEKELAPIFSVLRDVDNLLDQDPLFKLKQLAEQCIIAINFVKAGEGSET
ncbi:type III-B CRISPR-associated protein Cas10/Cmr2 [Paenibacillus azoreducens]|uniref:type III-B CRISPR-associated protein Cas10/Cmr2 n=1 Tax=Paenibacillus azoreducens TaxID=116718 RepID=UPI0039F5F604